MVGGKSLAPNESIEREGSVAPTGLRGFSGLFPGLRRLVTPTSTNRSLGNPDRGDLPWANFLRSLRELHLWPFEAMCEAEMCGPGDPHDSRPGDRRYETQPSCAVL